MKRIVKQQGAVDDDDDYDEYGNSFRLLEKYCKYSALNTCNAIE
jgi:hypothetical protein